MGIAVGFGVVVVDVVSLAEAAECKWPVLIGETGLVEIGTRTLDDSAVGAFDNAIALVSIGISYVIPDAFRAAGGMDFKWSVGIPMVAGYRTFEILD